MGTLTDVSARRRIDRYELEDELGRGGMGIVYTARDTQIDRRVALKVVTPGLADDPGYVARFEQEMRVAAALEHPNVVPVYEVGRSGDGDLFIAMRLVDGEDLKALIAREGALDPARVGRIARQIGGALDTAHAAGLIHRDVKPANILLTGAGEDEHAYLVDFGLAREAAAQSQLTAPGEWIGTLDYAAPEQIEAAPLRAAADVYALACVMFCALTGAPPFGGSTAHKVAAHMHEPLPSVGGALAAAVDPVLARATAKDPARRHASAGAFGRELDDAIRLAGAGAAAAPGAMATTPDPGRSAATESTAIARSPGRASRRPAGGSEGWRRTTLAAALGGAALLAVLLAVVLAARDGGTHAPTTATAATDGHARTQHRPKPKAPPSTTYTAPAGGYTAEIPTGAGWTTQPEQNLGGVLRTVVTGPDGAQVWIDATPAMAPSFGTDGRTAISTSQYKSGLGTVTAYRFRGTPAFCTAGCLDDQIDLGGHGFAVMGGPTPAARLAARHAMRTLRPVAPPPAATTTQAATPPPPAAAAPGQAKKPKKPKGHGKKDG